MRSSSSRDRVSIEDIRRLERMLGLDKPAYLRYVVWLVGDVTELDLGKESFDVWHDRAVFHFLVSYTSGSVEQGLGTDSGGGPRSVVPCP